MRSFTPASEKERCELSRQRQYAFACHKFELLAIAQFADKFSF